jgi:hypothetical protein
MAARAFSGGSGRTGGIFTGRALTIAALSILLDACASSEQIAQQQMAAAQTAQAQREARCSSFGYQPGTPDYSRCLERMYDADQQQIAAQQAQQAASWDALGARLQRAGNALEQVGTPPPQVMAANVTDRVWSLEELVDRTSR